MFLDIQENCCLEISLSSCNKGGLFVCFVVIASQMLEASIAQLSSARPSPDAMFRVGSASNIWVWVGVISAENIQVHFWACLKFD